MRSPGASPARSRPVSGRPAGPWGRALILVAVVGALVSSLPVAGAHDISSAEAEGQLGLGVESEPTTRTTPERSAPPSHGLWSAFGAYLAGYVAAVLYLAAFVRVFRAAPGRRSKDDRGR